MGRLAVLGGHSILGVADALTTRLGNLERRTVEGGVAPVALLASDEVVVVQRHGLDTYTPAHRVDHVANLSALVALGCDRILALSSVGSLRADLPVGTVVVPDDFIALAAPSTSAYHDARSHVVPGFDPDWRSLVLGTWREHDDGPVVDTGVYWQANGPRFETPAEIRYLAGFADVVGMTVGTECVVACELGLPYAAVCVVDNLANGLGDALLTNAAFEEGKVANAERVLRVLAGVVPVLAR